MSSDDTSVPAKGDLKPRDSKYLREFDSRTERNQHPSQLPNWAKRAIARYEFGDYENLAEAAEDHERARSTLESLRATPAGRKWIKGINEVLDDPARFAEVQLRSELHRFTMDFIEMWEAAKSANDYAEIRRMFETVMDRVPGGLAKKSDPGSGGSATIQIHVNSPEELEPVEVESEAVEADYEVLDD